MKYQNKLMVRLLSIIPFFVANFINSSQLYVSLLHKVWPIVIYHQSTLIMLLILQISALNAILTSQSNIFLLPKLLICFFFIFILYYLLTTNVYSDSSSIMIPVFPLLLLHLSCALHNFLIYRSFYTMTALISDRSKYSYTYYTLFVFI